MKKFLAIVGIVGLLGMNVGTVLATPPVATITVTSPTTSSTVSGTTTVSWTSTGSWSGNKVNVYYSSDTFTSTTTLVTGASSAGSYSWNTALQTNTLTGKIRIV
ncbi:MAG: hypothetical protein ACAH17_03880, partial [Candidatus Paceibacterota bacterium]